MILGLRTESRVSKQPASTITGSRFGQLCALKGDLQTSAQAESAGATWVTAGCDCEYSQLRLSSALYSSSHPDPACRKQGKQGRPCSPSIKHRIQVQLVLLRAIAISHTHSLSG